MKTYEIKYNDFGVVHVMAPDFGKAHEAFMAKYPDFTVTKITVLSDLVEPFIVGHSKEDQVKHMVDRFLGWHLPNDFNPDCGISFTQTVNESTHKHTYELVGTNLFTATQAKEMVLYMLEQPPL